MRDIKRSMDKSLFKPEVVRVDLHWGARGPEAFYATVEEDDNQWAWLADGDLGPFDSWNDLFRFVASALTLRYGPASR